MGPVVVSLVRIFIPLIILRYPLIGGVIAWLLDAIDVELVNIFGFWGDFDDKATDYQELDKYLDMFYLTLELYIVLSWKNLLARNTGIALFVVRLFGFIFYESLGQRIYLFLFPNLFEYFYIFFLLHKQVLKKDILVNYKTLLLVLGILLVPKLFQEYIAHVEEIPIWSLIKQSVGIEVITPK